MAKCLLCNSKFQDDVCFGEFLQNGKVAVHEFCLYLSSALVQRGKDDGKAAFFGFLPSDIKKESERVRNLICIYCNKTYANIGCCEAKCRRTFHLNCGLKCGIENQFAGTFRSYCHKHVRKDRGPRKPLSPNELCCICYELLLVPGIRNPLTSRIQAPCCKNGWFHRNCLQGFARSAGYFFKCPLCNDSKKFRARMPYLGIFLRNSDASWELEPNAFAELLQRPDTCDADTCLNKKGRKSLDSKENPMVYCVTCGSVAIHKQCLPKGMKSFDCTECKQIGKLLPITPENDSGRESIHVEYGEEEEIDVCYISDADDDEKEKVIAIFQKNSSSSKIHESFQCNNNEEAEDKVNDFMEIPIPLKYEEINSGDEQASDSSGNSSQESNETDSFRQLKRKRMIPIEFEHESDDNKTQIKNNNCTAATHYDDKIVDDEDPLILLSKIIDNKEKLREYQMANDKKLNKQAQSTSNNTFKNDISNLSDSKRVDTNHQTEIYNCNSKIDSGILNSHETDNKSNINPFEISCIANRTRHRTTMKSKILTQYEKRKMLTRSPIMTTVYRNSDKNTKENLNTLDISCIANRTRRRLSCPYSRNKLSSIGEESDSESCDSYKTPIKNKKYNERFNNPRSPKYKTYSSKISSSSMKTSSTSSSSSSSSSSSLSSSSSSSSLSSSSLASSSESSQFKPVGIKKLQNKRLRILSSTDEEFAQNDSMINR